MKNVISYIILFLIFILLLNMLTFRELSTSIITMVLLGVVLLFPFSTILWTYIKHQPHKNPFRDGPIAHFVYLKVLVKYNAIQAILADNDPDRFLLETDEFLNANKLPKGLARIASDNRAVAYMQAGEIERAITIWKNSAKDEKQLREIDKINDDEIKVSINFNLCVAYLDNNQVSLAREHYDIVKEMQKSKRLGKELKAWFQEEFLDIDALFLSAENQYGAAREAYHKLLQDGRVARMEIIRHFELANIYELQGDIENQKKHLTQVAAVGNKHYKAKIARDKLTILSIR